MSTKIFGRKFLIEIIFDWEKNRTFFGRKKKNVFFWSKKVLSKKIQHESYCNFFESTYFSRSNIFSTFFFDRTFFRSKMFAGFFCVHLYRSQIFQRFQKSYLESRVMSLNRRKTSEFKNAKFFCRDSRILVTFGDMLCITTLKSTTFGVGDARRRREFFEDFDGFLKKKYISECNRTLKTWNFLILEKSEKFT